MKKSIYLKIGQKFNRLTIIKLDHIKKQGKLNREFYLCKCDCRWVDNTEQQNNKNNNRIVEYNNIKHTLAQWSKILNIGYYKLKYRLDTMSTIEKAFNFNYK